MQVTVERLLRGWGEVEESMRLRGVSVDGGAELLRTLVKRASREEEELNALRRERKSREVAGMIVVEAEMGRVEAASVEGRVAAKTRREGIAILEKKLELTRAELGQLVVRIGNILAWDYFAKEEEEQQKQMAWGVSSPLLTKMKEPARSLWFLRGLVSPGSGNVMENFVSQSLNFNSTAMLEFALESLKNKRTPLEKFTVLVLSTDLDAALIVQLADPTVFSQDDVDNDVLFMAQAVFASFSSLDGIDPSFALVPASQLPLHCSKMVAISDKSCGEMLRMWASSSGSYLTESRGIHIGPKAPKGAPQARQYGIVSDLFIFSHFSQSGVGNMEERAKGLQKIFEVIQLQYHEEMEEEALEISLQIPKLVAFGLEGREEDKVIIDQEELFDLDEWFILHSYIGGNGYQLTDADKLVHSKIAPFLTHEFAPPVQFPHLYRWHDHMKLQ